METRLRRNRRIGQPKHLPLELVRRILAPHANALFQMGDHGLCKFLLEQALTTHLQCHLGWACTTGRYALVRLMLRHGAFMDLAALMAVCNGNSILILRHIVETYQLPQQYLHAAISCCISSGSVGGLRYLVGRLTTLYHVRSAEAARIVVRSPDLGLLLSNGIVPGDTWMMYWAILLDSATAIDALLTCSLAHLDLDAAFVTACILGRLHLVKRLRSLGAAIGPNPGVLDVASRCHDPDTLAYLSEQGLIGREALDRSLVGALEIGRPDIAFRIRALGGNGDAAIGMCIRRGDIRTCCMLTSCRS